MIYATSNIAWGIKEVAQHKKNTVCKCCVGGPFPLQIFKVQLKGRVKGLTTYTYLLLEIQDMLGQPVDVWVQLVGLPTQLDSL